MPHASLLRLVNEHFDPGIRMYSIDAVSLVLGKKQCVVVDWDQVIAHFRHDASTITQTAAGSSGALANSSSESISIAASIEPVAVDTAAAPIHSSSMTAAAVTSPTVVGARLASLEKLKADAVASPNELEPHAPVADESGSVEEACRRTDAVRIAALTRKNKALVRKLKTANGKIRRLTGRKDKL